MKKYIRAFCFLILPSFLLRLFFKSVGKGAKIGFSIVVANHVKIDEYAHIGHFVIIYADGLDMSKYSRIKFLTIIKGRLDVRLGQRSTIGKLNKISNPLYNDMLTVLSLGNVSTITSHSFIDLSRSVVIDDNSCIAGIGTQIFTHSFYHIEGKPNTKVVGGVFIGRNVYIGTRSIILANVTIGDNIVVGAGAVVGKDLLEQGAYVQSGLKRIDFKPAEKLKRLHKINDGLYEMQKRHHESSVNS